MSFLRHAEFCIDDEGRAAVAYRGEVLLERETVDDLLFDLYLTHGDLVLSRPSHAPSARTRNV